MASKKKKAKKAKQKIKKPLRRRTARQPVLRTGDATLQRSVQKRVDSLHKLTLGFARKLRDIEFSLENDISVHKKSTDAGLKSLGADFDDKLALQAREFHKSIFKLNDDVQRQIIDVEANLSNRLREFEHLIEDVSIKLQRDIDVRQRLEGISPNIPGRLSDLERQIETSQHLMTEVVELINKFRSQFDMRKVDSRISQIENRVNDLDLKEIKALTAKLEEIRGELKKAISSQGKL
ncbi:MAG: hypothetical protein ABH829_02245 [archaeon]